MPKMLYATEELISTFITTFTKISQHTQLHSRIITAATTACDCNYYNYQCLEELFS